jgi:ubiquinone/menaquinone biosynthesis C-methylase UbiE
LESSDGHTAFAAKMFEWRWMDTVLRQRAREIVRLSGLSHYMPTTGLLLDVGSGSGHVAEAVIRRMPGRRCVVVDPVHRPPRRLADRMSNRTFYAIRGSGERLPFADGQFDGAWLAFVLHHMLPDAQDRMLAEVARVVKPGGAMMLLEDTPGDAFQRRTTLTADRRLNFEPISAPHHYRSAVEWLSALSDHEWALERQSSFIRLFPWATIRAVPHTAFACRRADANLK